MKRFTQFVCILLVVSCVLAIPSYATEIQPYASDYFMSHSCYLWEVSDTQIQIWFDVRAMSTMDQLGASVITVQRSSDRENWTDMRTYTKEDYPQMIATNTASHANYVTYTRAPGYYYRAYVKFYAKKGSATGTYSKYTSYL